MRSGSTRDRLVLYLLLGLVPTFLVFSYLGENYSKRFIYSGAMLKAKVLALDSARQIEYIASSISRRPENIALLVEHGISIPSVERTMREYVYSSGQIYGMALAFLPQYSPTGGYFCPYYYFSRGHMRFKNLVPPGYDYMKFEWFYRPIEEDKALWSEPYFDKGGGEIWMSTFSVPIRDESGRPVGIATADASISFLSSIVSKIKILKSGGAFILSTRGNVLAPLGKYQGEGCVAHIVRNIHQRAFRKLVKAMEEQQTGFDEVFFEGRKYLIYHLPLHQTNWSIGVVFPENELFAPLKSLNVYFMLAIAGGISLIVFIVFAVSNKTTKDLVKIKEVSSTIADGDFNVSIPEDLTNEAKSVGEALRRMQSSLRLYINKVEETAKLEKELELARDIQNTFIPANMSGEFSGCWFEAVSIWAKQVGGDFYGVSPVDDGRVVFYLGDVSGKGVPAALYVALEKSVIEVLLEQEYKPNRLVSLLNEHMVKLSGRGMFSTLFVGLLDLNEGLLYCCNAGHVPPLLCSERSVSCMVVSGDVPVGAFPGFEYRLMEYPLSDLKRMIVYSDGLPEARNEKGEVFGEERIARVVLNSMSDNIVRELISEHKRFVGSAELHDDTTVLGVKIS